MKALVIAAALLVSATAMAGEFTSFSKIVFQGNSAWVPSNTVCQKNGYYFHTKKTGFLKQVCRGSEQGNCENVFEPIVPQPIVSTRSICAKYSGGDDGNCVKYATVPFIQKPVAVAKIYRSEKAMEDDLRPYKTVSYAIPTCGSTPVVPAY